MKKLFYKFIVLLFCFAKSKAQDPQFSLYSENPSMLNPALTGVNHVLRASVSYKDQWRNVSVPYKTFGMNMDIRFKPDNWQQIDKHRGMTYKERTLSRLAGGFSIYSDKAGVGGYSALQTNLNVAYFVPLTKNQFLSFGLQAGLYQKQIINEKFVFSNQYNGATYDKSISSGESFNSFYEVYPDFAAGALWAYQQRDKRVGENGIMKMNVGYSMYHLTQPRQGFLKQKQSGEYRMNVHGEVFYLASKSNLGYSPSFNVCKQGNAIYVAAGTFINFYFSENSKYTGLNKRSSLSAGAFYKTGQIFAFSLMYEKSEQYAVALCYDASFSQVNLVAQGRAGFELLLRYTPPMAFLYEKK